jgi:hypothetical protein
MSEKIKERDKPFILALASVALFAGEIAAGVYMAIAHPSASVETLKEAMTATIGFVSAAWTFYLARKNKE